LWLVFLDVFSMYQDLFSLMRPVTTDDLREYIELLTRMGKWDSIEFPAVEGEGKP
jgi:hypothetical protein